MVVHKPGCPYFYKRYWKYGYDDGKIRAEPSRVLMISSAANAYRLGYNKGIGYDRLQHVPLESMSIE
jgi:hypothetical protein